MSTLFSGSSAISTRPPPSMKRLIAAYSSGWNGVRGPMIASSVIPLGTSFMRPSAALTERTS